MRLLLRERALRCLILSASTALIALGPLSCVQAQDASPEAPVGGGSRRQTQSGRPLGINQRTRCKISRISDGDSITCDPLGRIRLLLIDAPELSEGEIGRQARRELIGVIPPGTEVIAETDVRVTDRFGRVLAYLFLPDGEMVNEKMAESGYATSLVYPPNVKYAERIRAAVTRARNAKRGLWASGGFDCSPRDYRAGRCR